MVVYINIYTTLRRRIEYIHMIYHKHWAKIMIILSRRRSPEGGGEALPGKN